jgi:ubiquinone/menaquinone biosynthesis C-methylase UbiE
MDIHKKVVEWETKIGVELFEYCNIPKNAIVIDFGCGYGHYSVAISQHLENGEVYSVDKDKKALAVLKKKINDYSRQNIKVVQNKGELNMEFEDCFADAILLFDIIHGSDLQTKMPIRFKLFEEAHRVLKPNGILAIAPFNECNRMRDKTGKQRKYTKEQVIKEISDYGFELSSEVDNAIHFEMYHSAYQWKKHNDDLQFEDMETGAVWNFIKCAV